MTTQGAKIVSILSGVLVALAACQTPPGPISSVEIEGFQPFPSFRDFDGPGHIYRITPESKVFSVTELEVTPSGGKEILPRVTRKSELSLKQVLETIGVTSSQFPAVASFELERKRNFVTESVNGRRQRLSDKDVDSLLPVAFSEVKIREDNTYYLIRETILTDNINYKSGKAWLIDLGIEAEFQDAVKANAELDWTKEKEFSLDKNFGQELNVWYKAERIEFDDEPLGAGPGQPVLAKTVAATPGEFIIPVGVPKLP